MLRRRLALRSAATGGILRESDDRINSIPINLSHTRMINFVYIFLKKK